MRLPRMQPANDNGGGVTVIPVFVELLARHDLTRTDVLVYGALVAQAQRGERATVVELATMLGLSADHEARNLRRNLRRIEAAGLIERRYRRARGEVNEYVLSGPTLALATER